MELNAAQRRAADADDDPLLIIAGAGTGKTQTLAHRVAALIARGADSAPHPAADVLAAGGARDDPAGARAHRAGRAATPRRWPWAGTFHAVANRLLRHHAHEIGLDPAFTLLDREDAADLLDRLRHERGLSRTDRRFPRKGTCLAIYSRVVNTQEPLRACLETRFPWCLEWEEPLRALFAAYVDAKAARAVLDYDDLLLYWFHLMGDASLARARRRRCSITCWSTSTRTPTALQAEILRLLKPDGRGVTVVGDDAQAIYWFRAARVRNILAFPAPVRSARGRRDARAELPLDAADPRRGQRGHRAGAARYAREAVLGARAARAATRPRWPPSPTSSRRSTTSSTRVLERREAGVPLRQQAVLFRAVPPQRRAGGGARPPQHPLREVRRPALPGGRARQGRAVPACAGRRTRAMRWPAFRVAQLLPGMGPRLADGLLRHVAGAQLRAAARAGGLRAARRGARRLAGVRRAVPRGCAPPPRRGRRRWAWCAAGISRTWSGSTTTRGCGSAISSSSSSWRRRRRRASASCRT